MPRPLSDTSREAERVLVGLAREMQPRRKLEIAASMSRMIRELALVGLRSRHPGAMEDEIRRRLASLVLPRDLAKEVCGGVPVLPEGLRPPQPDANGVSGEGA